MLQRPLRDQARNAQNIKFTHLVQIGHLAEPAGDRLIFDPAKLFFGLSAT
jgi:hypothetical protein